LGKWVKVVRDKNVLMMCIESRLDKAQYLIRTGMKKDDPNRIWQAYRIVLKALGDTRKLMGYFKQREQQTLRAFGFHPEWQTHHKKLNPHGDRKNA